MTGLLVCPIVIDALRVRLSTERPYFRSPCISDSSQKASIFTQAHTRMSYVLYACIAVNSPRPGKKGTRHDEGSLSSLLRVGLTRAKRPFSWVLLGKVLLSACQGLGLTAVQVGPAAVCVCSAFLRVGRLGEVRNPLSILCRSSSTHRLFAV